MGLTNVTDEQGASTKRRAAGVLTLDLLAALGSDRRVCLRPIGGRAPLPQEAPGAALYFATG